MGELININGRTEEKEDQRGTGLEALVWTCNACGNSTFQLLEGGAIRCACCNLHCTSLAHFDPRS